MPRVTRSALVPYAPEQMFDLVRDVERYPEFLAWVRSARVHDEDAHFQRATLEVRLASLVRSFTTLNRLESGRSLAMRLESGPFDALSGRWDFEPLGGGSRVALDLEFRLAGSALLLPFQRHFGRMADRMVDDFSRRADAIYGR